MPCNQQSNIPTTTSHNHLFCQHTLPPITRMLQAPAFLDLSPTRAMAKSGDLTPSGWSTATSVTSFSTNSSKDIFQDDFALLATLQECKIHAPPSPRQARAGVCGTTKTQLQSKRKATKDAKAKAVEEKIVVAACKAKAIAKKRSTSFPLPRPRRLRQVPR